jgi:hypothetical protein
MQSRVVRWLACIGLSITACGDGTSAPTSDSAKAAPASASAKSSAASVAPTASASASAPEAPKAPPVLSPARILEKELPEISGVYEVSGELLVSAGRRVGRVNGNAVEWVAEVSGESGAFGTRFITWVGGRYPDALDGYMSFTSPRAPVPTYVPLTGKGQEIPFAGGGGGGWLNGAVWVGESLVVQGSDMFEGQRIIAGRGKAIQRYSVPAESQGCESNGFANAAVRSSAFGAAANGMLVAAGTHCKDEGAALEVWAPNETKGKIVKLEPGLLGKSPSFQKVYPAGSDGVWITSYTGILEFRNNTVKMLPELSSYSDSTISEGALYVADGLAVHRLDNGAWTKVASFNWNTSFGRNMVLHKGKFYRASVGLEEFIPTTSIEFSADCTTPFVWLYDVKSETPKGFAFPATRKALANFAERKSIALVEFAGSTRSLGVSVPSEAVGKAVIAHLKTTMKEEKPRLLCLKPQIGRTIELGQ